MSKHHVSARRAASRVGLAAVLVGVFAFVAGQAGAVTGSSSGFESGDGNMVLNSQTANVATDWNCFIDSDSFSTVGSPDSNCKVTSGANHILGSLNGNLQWISGQKFDDDCPGLNGGNNPPKDQFLDVASYSDANATTHDTFFYGAAIRQSANGNASGDVEFNQNSSDDPGTTIGCRTAGDKLLAYDFLNGGGSAVSLHVLTWITADDPATTTVDESTLGGNSGTCYVSHDSMPCWGAHVISPIPGLFDGETNAAAITAANNGISGAALAINQFAEFGVNLTQVLGLTGCINFPQQVWESRSSGSSFGSNPEDIIIQNRTIQTCGEIKIIKQTDPRGQDQKFSFSSASAALPANADAGGVPCTTNGSAGISGTGTFCLNDSGNSGKTLLSKTAANNSTGNTIDATNVPQGTYTITEGTEPGAFSFDGAHLSCTSDATSGSSATTSAATQSVTINLSPGGVVTCLFVNQLHQGAIVITKTGKDVNCASATDTTTNGVCTGTHTAKLGGAKFKVFSDSAATQQVGSELTTSNTTGTACIDGLSWATGGTSYYVKETGAPTGFAIKTATAQEVSVSQNATCSATTNAATISFDDDPLTNLTVTAAAQKAGATQSRITCVDSSSNNIGNSPVPSASTYGDNITFKADNSGATNKGLKPGTYTCTVIIDP